MNDWQMHIEAIKTIIEDLQEWHRRYTKPAKLLVVDDDPDDVRLLLRDLENYYCEVDVCSQATEAEKKLAHGRYDFILIDQKMPELSGMQLIKRTIPNSQSGQFFIVSGIATSDLVNEATRLGAVFLPKPIKPFFLLPKSPLKS